MLSVSVICADDTNDADLLGSYRAAAVAEESRGLRQKLPTPITASNVSMSEGEWKLFHGLPDVDIIGNPATVSRKLDAVIGATNANEVMVTTVVHDLKARIRSYELLSEMYLLPNA